MPAKKTTSKSSASKSLNKKTMKKVKGGLLPAVIPTSVALCDGSVRPVATLSTTSVKL